MCGTQRCPADDEAIETCEHYNNSSKYNETFLKEMATGVLTASVIYGCDLKTAYESHMLQSVRDAIPYEDILDYIEEKGWY